MRRWALMTLLLAGCAGGVAYTPPPAVSIGMSQVEARQVVRQTMMAPRNGGGRACQHVDRVVFLEAGIVLHHVGDYAALGWAFYPYPALRAEVETVGTYVLLLPLRRDLAVSYLAGCQTDAYGGDSPAVHRYADAMAVLLAPRPGPDFERIAAEYRAAPVKPALSEAVRRWRVQAEAAVRAQRFDDAAELFAAALAEAPWWPEGHFNRALVLAESGVPPQAGAVVEMRRYLMLVPDAADARAAQDKIYEWEAQAAAAPLTFMARPSTGGAGK